MSLENIIYEKIATLSSGQRKVADYILKNMDAFSYSTLAKLSKDISVSETTIIRLAYSLGFDSFSAMQQTVRNEILSPEQSLCAESTTPSTLYQNVFFTAINALSDWSSHIKESQLDGIAKQLCEADTILVVGARSSHSTATWLGNRLNILLGNAHTVQEFYEPNFDLLTNITSKTIVLCLSFSRYTKWTYTYASTAKEYGAKLFTITDSISSPFLKISDETILAAPLKDSMGFTSMVCLYALFDALTAKIHHIKPELITERLKKYEDSCHNFDLFIE